eukprot:TRINITY_DN66247_c0_g1_i1.p1 TRINITY_DN66247_c0_g1~~TRINITY_DN66247_c0_g1_i1.p1  ORF type:complete len:327 (-),score=56.56 TRINITY_DN66247_c0_g1_i1:94-1074(-)
MAELVPEEQSSMTEFVSLELVVVAVGGEVVAELHVNKELTIADVKLLIAQYRPQAAPCWQRLVFKGEQLGDGDKLESLFGVSNADQTTLQLVLAVNVRDLILERTTSLSPKEYRAILERQEQAARAVDCMERGAAVALLGRLLEDSDGKRVEASVAEDILYQLCRDLDRIQPLDALKSALVEIALDHLGNSEGPRQGSCEERLSHVFSWLGEAAIPHLEAWLCLQPRPLKASIIDRLKLLSRHSESARVRLTAKCAMRDGDDSSLKRIGELVLLRAKLSQDALRASSEQACLLENLRAQALAELQDLACTTTNRAVIAEIARSAQQ